MNFLRIFLFSAWLIAAAHCQIEATTDVPNDVTQSPLHPELDRSADHLGPTIEETAAEESMEIKSANAPLQHAPGQLLVAHQGEPAIQSRSVPNGAFLPMQGPQPHPAWLAALQQRQIPPQFGFPFRPSIIRSQGPNFVALPPKEQPLFDLPLCQNPPESALKRDLEKRSLHVRHLGQFFQNTRNQDVLLSVCGTLMPGHLIVIESISKKFGDRIQQLKSESNGKVILNSTSDLLLSSIEAKDTEKPQNTTEPSEECQSGEFPVAITILIKFFYVGGEAFEDIPSLNVSLLLWKLSMEFLGQEAVQQYIEPQIGTMINMENLREVYLFMQQHSIGSLQQRWSQFITSNAAVLTQSSQLPLNCEHIAGDIAFLDRFIEALNVNQSMVIGYIQQYLQYCPESSSFTFTGENPFPRSLIYFRCNTADLKELIKMGFLEYEKLANILEDRLRAKEAYCEEKCGAKFVPVTNPNYRHVVHSNVGRRA